MNKLKMLEAKELLLGHRYSAALSVLLGIREQTRNLLQYTDESETLQMIAQCQVKLGELDAAEESLGDALDIAKKIGCFDAELGRLCELASLNIYRADLDKAQSYATEAGAVARRHKKQNHTMDTLNYLSEQIAHLKMYKHATRLGIGLDRKGFEMACRKASGYSDR